MVFYRARAVASDNVPRSGPVIIASNHCSSIDYPLLMAFLERRLSIVAKSELFRSRVSYFWSFVGAFPIRRGLRDEDAFETARRVLDRGGAVVFYCEGTRLSEGPLDSRPKSGVGRLALESGAPVVPVAIHGSALKQRTGRFWALPRARVSYGSPIAFTATVRPSPLERKAASGAIFQEIQRLYAELEHSSGQQ
jgi:1-acyl-sn-glycerol-3-phosphate acyltransferase